MEVGKYYRHIDFKDFIVKCIFYNNNTNHDKFRGLIISIGNEKFFYLKKGMIENFYIDTFEEYNEELPVQEPTTDQIGGSHYKKLKIQPTEFIHVNNLSFIEGNIIKYVVRHKDKNGIEDLKKARHYIDLLIKFEYEDPKKF